jgi:plastocyanin
VTNSGTSDYLFDQYSGGDPTLYVRAGETIAFNLNVSGHPFLIRVSSGGALYNTGLTHVATNGTVSTEGSAQAKESGTLYWKVPYNLLGNTYVYQCQVHAGMVGNIVIEPPGTIAYAQANAAYGQANSARDQANTARTQANTARDTANAAYGQANTARDTANAAYGAANTAGTNALNAYEQANTARGQANTARDQANTARTQANTAYGQANAAYGQANAAYGQANSAYGAANNAVLKAGDTMTGVLVVPGIRNSGNLILGTVANTNTNGANTLNLAQSNFFTRTLTANSTITFSNAPASGNSQSFTLVIVQDGVGNRGITWANTIYWAGGEVPPQTLTANYRDVWQFATYDGGSTYFGTLAIKDAR